MAQVEKYLMLDTVDNKKLAGEISQKYPTKIELPNYTKETYYDTFDWRLFNNCLSLFVSANEYSLRSLQDDAIVGTTQWKSKEPPKFWWDFHQASFREKLKRVMDMRALIPRGGVEKETQTVCILDDLEKTVLRLRIEKIQGTNAHKKTPLINLVTLEPVKGYRKYQRDISQFLSNLGKKREAIKIFSMVLSAAGEQSGDYSSKLHIKLQSGMSAKQATVIILKRLLELMRQNEAGIKTDIDTEFLHDFRVAVRRTRSALSQIKGIFPEEIVRRFKKDFAAVGKSTNQLRDLDVYLLNKERFKAMLPEEQRPKLEPLFQFLDAERKKQHQEFVQALNGAFYNEMLTEWETLLNSTTESGGKKAGNANKPVVGLACKFIFKQYQQVINLGNIINDSTPDEELHKLRIECKKLRYLLEFYAALFSQKAMAFLIKQLKSLQDNLGEFNDLCVQQPELKKFIDRVIPSHNESIATAVAIGGLIANLYHRQQQVRMAFSQKFQEFSQQENAELYQKLFR